MLWLLFIGFLVFVVLVTSIVVNLLLWGERLLAEDRE